jgi:hypothetical protein
VFLDVATDYFLMLQWNFWVIATDFCDVAVLLLEIL